MKAATFFLFLFVPATAIGQDQPDPFATARVHLGPVALTPTVALTNLGVDSNVFNNVQDPKSDFTATLSSQARLWMRLGKGRLSGKTALDYVYYGQYATERAVNTNGEIRAELPMNRVTPYATDSFLHARERPGYEIDVRSRHVENTVTLGTDLRVGPKTTVGVAAWHSTIRFHADEIFAGTHLREVLNRKAHGLRAVVRHKLTPLTTAVLIAETQSDRFDFLPVRNSDSVRIMPGVDLDPFALISGSARVGYRKYDARGPGAPSFTGLVAAADLGYTLRGVTHLAVHTERDLAYSFEIAEPYYLQTGLSGTVTQKVSPRWDVQGTAGRYRLDYRQTDARTLSAGRNDRVRTVGAGVGYAIGPTTRFGVSLNHDRRTSDREIREYNGLRVGTSMTYGF